VADQPSKKRQVKNPETFRERAAKAAVAADQPKRRSPAKAAGNLGRGLAPAARPFQKVGRTRPARIAGKILLPPYLRNSWRELRLVTWPNWNESRRLTTAVLIFAIIFGAVIALVDFGLDKLFRTILLK
jgi:preprotein translocase SecE subunit